MSGNRKLLWVFCALVLSLCALLLQAHRTVAERSRQLERLRNYMAQLSKAPAADSSLFFSRNFKENIEKDLSASPRHLERLNEFKSGSNYPTNLVLFIINHVSKKPSKDFAIPERSDSIIRLRLIELASQRVEFRMDFIDRGNYFVLDNIHDLDKYFSYLDCLELEKSKANAALNEQH